MGNCDIPSWLFFFIWIKHLKLWKPSAPSCPYNWDHLTSHLLSSFCSVFWWPSLNCLTGQLVAGECECRLGAFTWERHRDTGMHRILPLWNASSPASGDRSSPAQQWVNTTSWGGHFTEWTWLVTKRARLCCQTVGLLLCCIFVFKIKL